jgi:serine phosphatase RsbU (regulator of sigma subunit)
MSEVSSHQVPDMESRETEIVVAVFRTIFILIALFSPQFMRLVGTSSNLPVGVVIAAAVYNLALFILHAKGAPFPRLLIVLVDLMIITFWLYLCGTDSITFFVLYYPVVIVAGLWFGVTGALLTAIMASGCYGLIVTAVIAAQGGGQIAVGTVALQIALLIIIAGLVSFAAKVQAREHRALSSSYATLQRYRQQIQIARYVDEMLRPRRLPEAPGLDIAFRFRPAATAESGDYYDVIPLGGRRWGICVADVRGKRSVGIIYLPTFKSALRLVARREQSPAAVLQDVNREVAGEVADKLDAETFISLCYVVVDLDAGQLTYANAGHEPPVMVRGTDREIVALERTGLVLGVVPEATYVDESLPIGTGDTLVLFTDGMTEVADQENRMLGREKLLELLQAEAGAATAEAMTGRVFEFVNEYGKEGRRRDDMTLLTVRVTAGDLGPGGEVRPG